MFLFSVNSSLIIAQDSFLDICVTPDNTEPDTPGVHSYSKNPEVLANMEPVVVNIFYWQINDPEGNAGSQALNEQSVLESIQFINIYYNPFGVYFKYRGWDQFNSPVVPVWQRRTSECDGCVNYPIDPQAPDPCNSPAQADPFGYAKLSQCERYAMWDFAIDNEHFNENVMNVYVPSYGNEDFGGASRGIPANQVTSHRGGLTGNTFVHELGHALGLRHTFSSWIAFVPNTNCQQQYDFCEHVTRDPNNSEYNAHQKGDWVIDTPAMPDFAMEYCVINCLPTGQCAPNTSFRHYYIDGNCNYTGVIEDNRGDCQGTPYEIEPVDVKNMMSYSPSHCSEEMTVGQAIRIREFLDIHSTLQPLKDSIKSLYEPYKGEYYVAGPLPSPPNPPLFQPGFDYTFISCSGNYPEPSDFEDISFSYGGFALNTISKSIDAAYFNTITHPNHTAIQIDFGSYNQNFQNVRKCYDNWNRSPTGGSVTKFNDNIFNTNVTITAQDSTGINNPNLINNLDPGLYKIEKVYEDGAVQQNVIYKDQ
ncbi:MAG: hypothetical protein WDZ45_03695 [Flavobacteriaceae bacterium]